tara:strand:- start:24 stop:176 length:153 start_codon:yes stop_codon:yes gene_type:complete
VIATEKKNDGVLDNAVVRKLLKAISDSLLFKINEFLSGREDCVCELIDVI